MNSDTPSMPSEPTVAFGYRPIPQDEPSFGSAPTMRGRTAPLRGRLRVGDSLLGRYTVLAELGEGGMGVVYKCLDTVGGIEVAVKCLPPELSRNEAEMEGIRENYAIVARLHHSAISGLRQLEKDADFGEYYLVMDLAKGEDLSAVLRRRRGSPMASDETLAILRPLASALDYAHAEKVLHRDVKPGNVKVETLVAGKSHTETQRHKEGGATSSSEPHIQLLDFGLAAEVRSSMSRVSLRGHAGSSGTPAYMAPEQWEARRQSAATDQYSLAVMAYQMLSGALPFDADDMELLKSAVLSRPPDPVAELPRAANAALLRALAKDPMDRFPSCQAFVEALARGLVGAGASGSRRLWPWLAALAVAAAAAAGVFLVQSPQSPQGESHAEVQSAQSEEDEISDMVPDPWVAPETPFDVAPEPPAPPEPSAPALPPEGASLEELQAARDRFSDALEARRAEGWPDDSAESAPLVASIATLDGRITSALKEREEQERQNERERIEKRASDARAVAAIGRLKAAAVREVRGVEKFRKWNDGEFKAQFALLDRQKAALDDLSEASDFAKAKEAAADIHSAAVWIADNAEAREGLDELERAIDALSPELGKAEARRYAQSSLYAANTARKEAVQRRDRSDFTGAKEKFEEAKRLFDGALAEARKTQASARAREAVGEAEAAKIREDWETVLAKANAALALDADNADAKSLKAEAEAKLAAIKAELERKAREESERKAREEAAKKAREEAERKAREEAAKKAREEAERKAREEAAKKAREEAERKAREEEERARLAKAGAGTVAGERKVIRIGPQEIALRWCPPGTFLMGSPTTEEGRESDETQHSVTLTKGFWMGETEVTQGLWKEVMGGNPSYNKAGDDYPVEEVSWEDCQEFLDKLNARSPQSGLRWALPTEAQWEYACRAGTTCAYGGTGRLDDMGWYDGNSRGKTHPVGRKRANAWGLYDMHGNVWEWCADWWGDYPSGAVTDPTGPSSGSDRVTRGVSCLSFARICRSARRNRSNPGGRGYLLGFRVAMVEENATVRSPSGVMKEDHSTPQKLTMDDLLQMDVEARITNMKRNSDGSRDVTLDLKRKDAPLILPGTFELAEDIGVVVLGGTEYDNMTRLDSAEYGITVEDRTIPLSIHVAYPGNVLFWGISLEKQ